MKKSNPSYEELLKENEILKQQLAEKKHLEKELEKAQILMQAAFDQSPVPMVVVTYPDFTFKIINKATENFLLVDAENYLNKSPLEIEWKWQEYLPDGTKITNMGELPLPCALQGITTINKEMRIERIDGTSVWELASASPVYDDEGNLIAGFLAMVDITERKAIEKVLEQNKQQLQHHNSVYEALNEELRQTNKDLHRAKEKAEESELTFRKLFEDSADAILLINSEGVFVDCNQAALDLLKMRREQFLLNPPSKISPEYQPNGRKSEEAAIEMIALAYKNGLHRFDWTCVNAEGGEFIVEVSLMPIAVKGQTMLHTTWRDITNRKYLEETIRESELFFKESQQTAHIGSYRSEFYPNDIWKTSEVCDEIFGMHKGYNKTVQGWIELLHPDDAQMMIDYVTNEVIGKGVAFDKEYRIIRHNDGVTRWVWGRGQTIVDNTGRTTGLFGTIQDITERKHAELLLQEKSDKIVRQNEELNQINQELFNAKEKAEESKTIIQQQYQDLQATEEEIRAANEELMATTDALKETNNELHFALLKAEENETRFRSLFQNMNNSASHYEVIYNNEGIPVDYRFLDVNEFYEKSLGLKAADLIGKTLLEVFPATEAVWLDTFKQVVLTSTPNLIESYSREVDMYFELIVYCPQKGKLAMIGSDVTQRKRNEKELIRAKEKAEESDQLKTAFLENISHEVRTPMNAILGFSELLLKQNLDDQKRKHFTHVLQESTQQLLKVVDNTITLAQIETNQLIIYPKEFYPNVLLDDLFTDYFTKKQYLKKENIQLVSNNNGITNRSIINDFSRITEIFTILLDNALKFTEKGSIEFGYAMDEREINFYVKDTGIGIPSEKQQLIFKSFTQSDKNTRQLFGGLGVGLSIAMGLVKLIHGKITINSEVNVGTEIIFSLPIKPEIHKL